RDKAAKEATARATALREAPSSNVGQESSSSDPSTPSKKSNTTKNVASNANNSAPSAATPSSGGYSAMISAATAHLGKPYSLG
ncbi:peptidase P60, partial [Listeria monocytogenes]|nr:peptidase P60 [Listeria monocytogenes]